MGREIKILTTGQIAKYCGVHFRTVIRWIQRGHLKSYKLPGRGDNRIRAADFVDFLLENEMDVPADFSYLITKNPSPHTSALIIDDESPVARSISRVLKGEGFEFKIAASGLEAGALIVSENPDLITLDLNMPGMGGLDVLKYLRDNPDLKEAKILVISGLAKEKLEEAIRLGADSALAKPFTKEQLAQEVSKLINIKNQKAKDEQEAA